MRPVRSALTGPPFGPAAIPTAVVVTPYGGAVPKTNRNVPGRLSTFAVPLRVTLLVPTLVAAPVVAWGGVSVRTQTPFVVAGEGGAGAGDVLRPAAQAGTCQVRPLSVLR